MASFQPHEPLYNANYDEVKRGKYCEFTINAADHELADVRKHHCYTKCSGGDDSADCADYNSRSDTRASNALCAPLATLQDLCTRIESCYGVTHHVGQSHGFLNSFACAAETAQRSGPGQDLYVRATGATPDCALGVGAEITGGPVASLAGVYEKLDDYSFAQLDAGGRIVWHHSGCGWAVVEDQSQPAPVPTPPAEACKNNAHLAALLLGDWSGDSDACAVAGAWGGRGSYCRNDLFAGVCSGTCNTDCRADNNKAATGYLATKSIEGTCDASFCSDSVVATLCPVTCVASSRRLSKGQVSPSVVDAFRRQIADARLNDVADQLAVEEVRTGRRLSHYRRLGWEQPISHTSAFREVYYTWDALNPPVSPMCSNETVPDETLLTTNSVYDLVSWGVASGGSVSLTCKPQDRYVVGAEMKYCQFQNVAVSYNENPDIVANGCYRKCNLDRTSRGLNVSYANAEEGGVNDWCSGNFPQYTETTNALCLPREECEQLCTTVGEECQSFDMHRKYPICYLNGPECFDSDNHEVNRTWDVIVKQLASPAAVDLGDDPSRDTYRTFSGVNLAGSGTQNFVGLSREACEEKCSRDSDSWCAGFSYQSKCPLATGTFKQVDEANCDINGHACTLFGNEHIAADGSPITTSAGLDYSVVVRDRHEVCAAVVTGAGFDGSYAKIEGTEGGNTFLRADGLRRVRYVSSNETGLYARNESYECDGWLMQTNGAAKESVTVYNCTDYEVGALAYYNLLYDIERDNDPGTTQPPTPDPALVTNWLALAENENMTADDAPGWYTMWNKTDPTLAPPRPAHKFPCQTGQIEGKCADVIFAGLCPHTCGTLKELVIDDAKYYYQLNATQVSTAKCLTDDHKAAFELWSLEHPAELAAVTDDNLAAVTDSDACTMIAHQRFQNHTHNPCHMLPISGMLRSLCKGECFNTTIAAPVEASTGPGDESSGQGAQYGGGGRRLADGTTSWSGAQSNELTIWYVNGAAANKYWNTEFRSWHNGSSAAESPVSGATWDESGFTAGAPCHRGTGIGHGVLAELRTRQFYAWEIPTAEVKLETKCRVGQQCPELTNCVLSSARFADELDGFYGGATRAGFLADLSAADRAAVLVNFSPRTITTEARAQAFIVGVKHEFARGIARAVPGAPRVGFSATGISAAQFGEQTIVTVVSPVAGEGMYALTELGRGYELDQFWSAWKTDVVRVERFDASGEPQTEGSFTFDIAAPGASLTVFMFPSDGSAPVQVPAVEAANGYVRVTAPRANADFVGAEDVDECKVSNPCHANADCLNQLGAAPKCECKTGYSGDGVTECALVPEAYSSDAQHYYFRLEHKDRLEFGWRIKEIAMYANKDCANARVTGARSTFPDGTYVYTGETGFANYPGDPKAENPSAPGDYTDYSNKHLFDEQSNPVGANKEWWSAGLHLNPEVKDPQHGGASIEWIVRGTHSIDCVQVVQNQNHMSKGLRLSRGPAKGRDCGMGVGETRCEPTEVWDVTKGATADIETTCGEDETQLFGEILELESASWRGSYPAGSGVQQVGVPSACHCMALCVQHIGVGCRSYKFYSGSGVKHCYLQSGVFEEGEGYYGAAKGKWPNWRSGTPGRRILGFTPTTVVPGESFELKIDGVALPFSKKAKHNTAPRQRIKIMEASQECYEKPPEEVSGIGCTETTRTVTTSFSVKEESIYTICSPRPTTMSEEVVAYSDIMITAASDEREYKVCYCATQCYEASSYAEIPGRIRMARSTFLWSSTPSTVYRKDSEGAVEVRLTVSRPTFGSFSEPRQWELKVVRDYFGCSVLADNDKFACTDAGAPTNRHDTTKPQILWRHSSMAANPENVSAAVGLGVSEAIELAFNEPVVTDGCSGSWSLQSRTGQQFASVACGSAVAQGSSVYLKFSDQTANMGGGVVLSWPDSVVADANGNGIEAGDSSATNWVFDAGDSGVEISAADPPNGGQATSSPNITFSFSRGGILGVNNLTMVDCGPDGSCDSEADNLAFGAGEVSMVVGSSVVRMWTDRALLRGRRFRISVPAGSIVASGGAGPANDYTYEFLFGCSQPSYLENPDVAVWVYTLNVGVEDTGAYAVCFREEGSGTFAPMPSIDEKFFSVHKVEADRVHPRGVFHNQYFAALAGSSRALNLSIAGTRVPVPSDAKIVLNKHPEGKCGDMSKFVGVPVVPAPRSDSQAPVVDLANSIPPAGAVSGGVVTPAGVNLQQAIVLQFNEAVATEACRGNFTFHSEDAAVASTAVDCRSVTAHEDRVIVMPDSFALASGTFFLEVDTGAVQDLAGNDLTVLYTDQTYRITTGSDTTAPQLVHSFPCNNCEGPLSFQDFGQVIDNTVVFYFSEPVAVDAATSTEIVVVDCGADFICDSSDTVVNTVPANSLSVSFSPSTVDGSTAQTFAGDLSFNRMYVNVGVLDDHRRYEVTIPAGVVTAGGMSNQESVIEFVKTSASYSYTGMVVASSGDQSSEDALVYPLRLYGNTDPTVEYTVCYCDDQNDNTLQHLGDGDTTYGLYDDVRCSNTTLVGSVEVVADRTIAEHQCDTKCARGCTGPFCYCDGYLGATADTLCLPPSLCRAACDATAGCTGINVHDSKPQCMLVPEGHSCMATAVNGTASDEASVVEDWQLFAKRAGTACTHLADFQERAGTLYVTARVEVAVDYVLHPGEEGSIELTAPEGGSLTYDHEAVYGFTSRKLLSRDRITVIDCKGTCGISAPTSAILLPSDGGKISTWNDFLPFSWFVDLPAVDTQNPSDAEKTLKYTAQKKQNTYTKRDGFYCPTANIQLSSQNIPSDGTKRPLSSHQCYRKCSLEGPCDNSEGDCHCGGHYSGYDGIDSNALCADTQLCQYLCDQTPGCVSIDMHNDISRCFLNHESQCDSHEDKLAKDAHYSLLVKAADPNDEQAGASRRLLPAVDFGYSWDKLLRFKPVQFKSGGTFKLCFCDSEILGAGQACSTERDYKIEVGTIHASGVSCLISQPALQRVSCTPQRHGGLRCYEHMEAPTPEPPVIGTTVLPSEDVVTAMSMSAKCLYMPEEEARNDPQCQTVSGHQSTTR